MFPPKTPQGMPPAAGAAPQPPAGAVAPPGAGAPPDGGPQQSGLRQVSDIGFNQDVQNILLSRIQTLTPQEEKVLDAVLTPQTIPVFVKIFPELKPLFDMLTSGGQQGPIGQPGQQGQPAQGGAPAQGAPPDAEDAGPGGDNGSDEEEESDNPLVKSPASAGLIG